MRTRRKRILFVTPPGHGHAFPIVQMCWAFRTAGHEILVATCGASLGLAMRAGIPVTDVAPGQNLTAIFERFQKDFGHGFPLGASQSGGDQNSDPGESLFSVLGNLMVDGVIQVATEWRADIIVHTPDAAAAPVAAAVVGLPTVFLGLGLAHTPEIMWNILYSRMGDACRRHGAAEISPPAAWLDVAPPSLIACRPAGWPMRYLPFNGGDVMRAAPVPPKQRIRLAVTLGTIVPLIDGIESLQWIVNAAARVDAEFVIAHGMTDCKALGTLPSNVRATTWTPLDSLLSDCNGVIHHGGSGTTLTALDAGLAQIIIPRGSDQFYNAATVAKRGAAIVPEEHDRNIELLRRFVASQELSCAAREIQEEMWTMPPPPQVAQDLLAFLA